MEKTRIYLIRHGDTLNGAEPRFYGHTDVELTETGIGQMEAVAFLLRDRPIQGLYSSDLARSIRGAEEIQKLKGIKSMKDARFKEISAGRWEGLTFSEAEERFPEEAAERYRDMVNYRLTGGESFSELSRRVVPALNDVLLRHKGQEAAIVAHGGVNRVILCHALRLGLENLFRIEQDYGCLNIIDFYEDTAVIVLLNRVADGSTRI